MSLLRFALCLLGTAVIGCTDNSPLYLYETNGTVADLSAGCPTPPDLAPPAAKCAAAAGLAGTNLLCVDFNKLSSLSELPDWNFTMIGGNCWEIDSASKKLQVKNFSTFASSCGFLMPAVSDSDLKNYNNFTLSVVQRVDLYSLQQKALVMLGGDDEQLRLLDWMTGKQPRKQWVQTIAKADLPSAAGGMFQPLFKLTAGMGGGQIYQGWQIESIAVNASK